MTVRFEVRSCSKGVAITRASSVAGPAPQELPVIEQAGHDHCAARRSSTGIHRCVTARKEKPAIRAILPSLRYRYPIEAPKNRT